MGNVNSSLNGRGGPETTSHELPNIPGSFPILNAFDRLPGQEKRPSRSFGSNSPSNHRMRASPQDSGQPTDDGKGSDPNSSKGSKLEDKYARSTIRAKDAWVILEDGLSLQHDFEWVRRIGHGSQGDVGLVRKKNDSSLFAFKVLKKNCVSSKVSDLPPECLLHLEKIRIHPHILFMAQIDIVENSEIWMCSEFCNAGDLLGQILRFEDMNRKVPVQFVLHVFIQLASAIAYLHHGLNRITKGEWKADEDFTSIIHGDIKPESVFLHFGPCHEYGMPDIILGDFGHSTPASEPRPLSGTPLYFCPEAMAYFRGNYEAPAMSTKSDIYTFGLTMYALIMGDAFKTGSNPSFVRIPRHYYGLGLAWIFKHCLKIDPAERPSMDLEPGTGLLELVDQAWELRHEMFLEEGPVDKDVWNKS